MIEAHEVEPVQRALLRYRVMAWIVGVLLVALVVASVGHHVFGVQWEYSLLGQAHGWLYAVLLLTAYDVGRRVEWSWTRLIVIALAGTVPFLTFLAEHRATVDVRRRLAEARASGHPAPEPSAQD